MSAAVVLLAVVAVFAAAAPAPQLAAWPNTTNGTHLFLTFDDHVDVRNLSAAYVYAWGSDQVASSYRRSAASDIVLTHYTPFCRDPGYHNLSWWQAHHPTWVLYKCDRTTPAYEFNDPNVPLDVSNPEVLAWQLAWPVAYARRKGYNGMAMDNFDLYNGFRACGVYAHNGTTGALEWKQLYTGEPDDPTYVANMIGWAQAFSAACHELGMLFTMNWSLGGMAWDDPRVLAVANASDGVLAEAGFTDYGSKILHGADFVNIVQHALNLQRHGKAYFPINEWGHRKDGMSLAVQSWVLAAYLCGKANASAVFASPIQGYGFTVPYRLFTDLPTGVPLVDAPLVSASGVYYRNFSEVLAVVNPTPANATLQLDADRAYVDAATGEGVADGQVLAAGAALVLQYV